MGFFIPSIIDNTIHSGIQELYMKEDGYDTWGETPGKAGNRVIRAFSMFNMTNVNEFMSGEEIPKVTEVGLFPFMEFSQWKNWEFLDDDYNGVGQDTTTDLLAYNYRLTLMQLANNDSYIPPDTHVTAINMNFYVPFNATVESIAPQIGLWNYYRNTLSLRTDFIDAVKAYALWNKYYSDETNALQHFKDMGFESEFTTIYTDPMYGWNTWKKFKYWIASWEEWLVKQDLFSGGIYVLQEYFQIPMLYTLMDNEIFTAQYKDLTDDMMARYNTTIPDELGRLQWANATLGRNMPFTGECLNATIEGTNFTGSVLNLNNSYTYPPEVYVFQNYQPNEHFPFAQYEYLSDTFLEYSLKYPMTNNNSMFQIDNLTPLFHAFEWLTEPDPGIADCPGLIAQTMEIFKFYSPSQIFYLAAHVGGITQLSAAPDGSGYDKYAYAVPMWSYKALTNGTVSMREDLFYGMPTRYLFWDWYTNSSYTCNQLLGGDYTLEQKELWAAYGWDVFTQGSWRDLEIWVKAAMKKEKSVEYQTLLKSGYILKAGLDSFLNDHLLPLITQKRQQIAQEFGCVKATCSFEEYEKIQMTKGLFTLQANLTTCGEVPSDSITHWYPDKYLAKIEWSALTGQNDLDLFYDYLFDYDYLYNPNILRTFMNEYHLGKNSTIIFPGSNQLYNYLLDIIPGFDLFATHTAEEWIVGYQDPFLTFFGNLSIYEAGAPSTASNVPVMHGTDDSKVLPRNVMKTGKSNIDEKRQYTRYYGAEVVNEYWPIYSTSAANATDWGYFQIWGTNETDQPTHFGTDGGEFSTYMDKDDSPFVFVTPFLKPVKTKYFKTEHYHGLEVYKFGADPTGLQNSIDNPANFIYHQNWYNGFISLGTQESGAGVAVSLAHCLYCDKIARDSVEYYAFSNETENYMKEQIFVDDEKDQPYATIEPLTGIGVKLLLRFSGGGIIYPSYFPRFKNMTEVEVGSGIFVPFYLNDRSFNYTYDVIQEDFGGLMFALNFKDTAPLYCTIGGPVFMAIGIIVACILLRRRKAKMELAAREQLLGYDEVNMELDSPATMSRT